MGGGFDREHLEPYATVLVLYAYRVSYFIAWVRCLLRPDFVTQFLPTPEFAFTVTLVVVLMLFTDSLFYPCAGIFPAVRCCNVSPQLHFTDTFQRI